MALLAAMRIYYECSVLKMLNILSCLLSAYVKFYVALVHRMLEGGVHACLAIFALIQFLGSSSIHYYPYVLVA